MDRREAVERHPGQDGERGGLQQFDGLKLGKGGRPAVSPVPVTAPARRSGMARTYIKGERGIRPNPESAEIIRCLNDLIQLR